MTATGADRRRAPRVELLSQLHGHVVSLEVPVRVLELSLGGMAIETTLPFPVGSTHTFSVTLGDGAVVSVPAIVRHCRPSAGGDAPSPVFTVGLQFVDDPSTDASSGAELLGRVK